MKAKLPFRFEVMVMLGALVAPGVVSAQSPDTAPGATGSIGAVAQSGKGKSKSKSKSKSKGKSKGKGKGRKVAVVSLEAPEDWLGPIGPGVKNGFEKSNDTGIGYVKVKQALTNEPELINCISKKCRTRIAKALKVEHFITIKITGKDLSLKLKLELWDTEKRRKVEIRDCKTCSLSQLRRAVARAIVEVLKPPAPVPIEITSTPKDAVLSIDGKEVGNAPYNGEIKPGEYTVQAALKGHIPEADNITVLEKAEVGGKVQKYSFVLSPVKVQDIDITPLVPPARPYLALKWVGLGGTLALLGAGAFMYTQDGQETECSDQGDPLPVCQKLWKTKNYAYATLGVAAAGALMTVLMLVSDHKTVSAYERAKKARDKAAMLPLVVPTRGGAMAQFQLRF